MRLFFQHVGQFLIITYEHVNIYRDFLDEEEGGEGKRINISADF